jgi:DNA helicase HerA-like ATPase
MPTLEQDDRIFVGKGAKEEYLALKLANRHGLVTGATGTGKTVTLQVLAEGFARAGVPVFAADIKGDLSGVAAVGEAKEPFVKRAKEMGYAYQPDEFSVVFWDLFGEEGHPVRTSVFEVGPLLLSRILNLNEVQEGVINIAFRYADDEPELTEIDANGLVDLKDLRELLSYIAKNSKEFAARYGNVASASIGAVQRQLLVLENQGAAKFFGEPALSIEDFMRVDRNGRGVINILAADKLIENPRLYATFLLWLLSELFEEMPEVGDLDKPKLVFFFDEAHLLFDEVPKALLDKIEQVVRLIRSKGVGVYFVTQNPLDVPEKVLAQLGNRVQHALRAFTARDQKAVRAAAETFRANPQIDTAKAITELGKGEALVSFLEGNGIPSVVERVLICPPTARVGPVTPEERKVVVGKSPFKGKYDTPVDPQSAYEVLQGRMHGTVAKQPPGRGKKSADQDAAEQTTEEQGSGGIGGMIGTIFGTSRKRGERLSTGQVARSHPLGRQSNDRTDRRQYRQVVGRIDGKLGRPRHRARHLGWNSATVTSAMSCCRPKLA